MKKMLVLFYFVLFVSSFSLGQSTVKGYVYHDVNGNGVRDRNEKGISEVAVSNGREVELTDKNGLYRLPVTNDNIIFVIKPAGYKVPVNKKKLPQFYYIHKPQGSPPSNYKGSDPTGPLPELVNFALFPDEEVQDFSALVFGDPQPASMEQVGYFYRGVVKELEGIENVKFGLSLGDLVEDKLELFQPYVDTLKRVGIPWYNVLGNHDTNKRVTADSLSDETFEAHFGPANYSFNYGKVHFIVLDDILIPDPRKMQGYWGGLRQDQLDFVANDLKFVKKDQLIVISCHIPMYIYNPENVSFDVQIRQRLFDHLKDYSNVLILSAHSHKQGQYFFTKEHGWQGAKPIHEYNVGTTSGDWYSGEFNAQGVPTATMRDGTPKGYAFLRFKGNQYVIDYKVAGKPANYQIEIFAPRVVPAGPLSSWSEYSEVYANVFMGYKSDIVQFRIDDGEWKQMTFTEVLDPSYVNMLHRWYFTERLIAGKQPQPAENSPHLWFGALPVVSQGRHTIEVKAIDMFGREFRQTKMFWAEKR